MNDLYNDSPSEEEEHIARDTLARYSGSDVADYQPYVLLTNFPRYVEYFGTTRGVHIQEGGMFKVAHSPCEKLTIVDFKIGSPAAALVIDLLAHLPIKAALLLGMCGGLRRDYRVGDYFLPIAGIRGEGTSDFYFPPEVPALANFMVQKIVTNILIEEQARFHVGITFTTNKRFWEFNEKFKEKLAINRSQAIELECATLFMASYWHKLPLGALLLISDLPLAPGGIKTLEGSEKVFEGYTADHVEKGVRAMRKLNEEIDQSSKGVFRGHRKRFENNDEDL